jgi:hypothetical protein
MPKNVFSASGVATRDQVEPRVAPVDVLDRRGNERDLDGRVPQIAVIRLTIWQDTINVLQDSPDFPECSRGLQNISPSTLASHMLCCTGTYSVDGSPQYMAASDLQRYAFVVDTSV